MSKVTDRTDDSPASDRWFTTTHWSVVLAATEKKDTPEGRDAFEKLCRAYWYPLYAFVRRKGFQPADAQDLTQGFLARLMQRMGPNSVDREKGRFRNFLLKSLKNYMADERERGDADKRGGKVTIISIDEQAAEERYRMEPVEHVTPEDLFQRGWAMTVLEGALELLCAQFNDAGKGDIFDKLKIYLSGETPRPTYAETGTKLGQSESAVRSAVARMKFRYGELIRAKIADTVDTRADLDDELQHLMRLVGK